MPTLFLTVFPVLRLGPAICPVSDADLLNDREVCTCLGECKLLSHGDSWECFAHSPFCTQCTVWWVIFPSRLVLLPGRDLSTKLITES